MIGIRHHATKRISPMKLEMTSTITFHEFLPQWKWLLIKWTFWRRKQRKFQLFWKLCANADPSSVSSDCIDLHLPSSSWFSPLLQHRPNFHKSVIFQSLFDRPNQWALSPANMSFVADISSSFSGLFAEKKTYGEGPMTKPLICDSIMDCIGGTPLVRYHGPGCRFILPITD